MPTDREPTRTTILGRLRSSTVVDMFAGYDWGSTRRAVRQQPVRRAQRALAVRGLQHLYARRRSLPGRPRTIGLRAGMKF